MKVKLLVIVALVVVGAAAVYVSMGGLPASATSTTRYLTAQAVMGDVTDQVAATGTVAPKETYGIAFGQPAHLAADSSTGSTGSTGSSDATYPVKTVDVAVGDVVTKGQLLATASGSDLVAALDQAANSWRVAKLQLTTAKESLTTAESGSNTDQIRQARIGVYNARNQEAQAHAAYADALDRTRNLKITSPIDGMVTAVTIQPGLDAPSGDAVTIASSAYEVTADAVESDIGSISVGQPAAITISATNDDLTGKVSSISPVAGSATNGVVSYAVTITLDSTPKGLRDGMSADVSITTASAPDVLTIPSAALRGGNGTYRVSVLDPSTDAPAQRDVTVGLVTNTLAEITGGLSEGEKVITGTVADLQSTTTNGGGAFPGGGFGGGQFRGGFGNGGGNGGNGNRGGG